MSNSNARRFFGVTAESLIVACLYTLAYAVLLAGANYMTGLAGFSLWFPAAGLRFALVAVFGWRFGLVAALAEIVAQGILGEWLIWHNNPLAIAAGIGAPPLMYALVIGLLLRHRLTNSSLTEFKYILWLCVAAVVAPALTAPVSASIQILGHRLAADELGPATLTFWIGDMVGILMLAPTAMLALTAIRTKSLRPFGEIASRAFAIEYGLALLFIWMTLHYASGTSPSLRWLPFVVPVIAISLRYGFAGASIIVLSLNTAIVATALTLPEDARVNLQIFLALLSLMGLLLGGLVSGKRRATEQLADQFKTLAHLDRMNTMGEMAAHIIHELAQPIHTTSLYAQGAVHMLGRGELDRESLLEAMTMAARETERTQELIRRMKMFARKGELVREQTTAKAIIEGIAHMIDLAAKQCGAEVRYELPDEPLPLNVDIIQIQQAILNLARNGFEAMEGVTNRWLMLRAGKAHDGIIWIEVKDTGPGWFAPQSEGISTKPKGMGVGLKIVEAIVAAHSGHFDREACRICFDTSLR